MSLINKLIQRHREASAAPTVPATLTGQYPEFVNAVPDDLSHELGYVLQKVRSMDTKPEDVRGGAEFIHGSSLLGMCPRREILAGLAGTQPVSPSPPDRIIWALGRAAETHVRTQFIRAVNRQGVFGEWSCPCGETTTSGFFEEKHCIGCGGLAGQYYEKTLIDGAAKIAGNPDLLYVRGDNGKMRVVEIKSMNKRDFDGLTRPKPDHVHQALIYRRLLGIEGLHPDDAVTIFYVAKDYAWQPYKEFHVNSGPALDGQLDDMWSRAYQVAEWKAFARGGQQQGLPARLTVCDSPNSTRAKNCDQKIGCFCHS